MHIGSTVRGKLRKDKSPLDAVDAVLPAGTLSGAPKIRPASLSTSWKITSGASMEGRWGYLDFSGNLDTCIGIRWPLRRTEGCLSVPARASWRTACRRKSTRRCANKAKAVVLALKEGEEMEA